MEEFCLAVGYNCPHPEAPCRPDRKLREINDSFNSLSKSEQITLGLPLLWYVLLWCYYPISEPMVLLTASIRIIHPQRDWAFAVSSSFFITIHLSATLRDARRRPLCSAHV